MNNSKKILTSVLHTAQMGQSGILTVMPYTETPALQGLLREQLEEYKKVEHKAKALAMEKGWQLPGRSMMVDKMSCMTARCRLLAGDKDSVIAGMLIQGNTRGMILGIKNLHKTCRIEKQVESLANELLNLETINLQKSQEYL